MHVVTVNDYLARRDSEWVGQVHKFLGLEVGLVQQVSSWRCLVAAAGAALLLVVVVLLQAALLLKGSAAAAAMLPPS